MSFETLHLHPLIQKAVATAGYTEPTPIQHQAIPEILAGHDIMASAQTGTGKTAAFVLPVLQKLMTPSAKKGKGPRLLVLTPTRELAAQITEAVTKYGKFMSLKCGSVLGGMPYPPQNRLLSEPLDMLIATPGRLIDHLERGRVDFSRLEVLVLDEADRMLDMGFIDDVKRIVKTTPSTRQTLLFSATLNEAVRRFAEPMLRTPKQIQITPPQTQHENIEERVHFVDNGDHKSKLLQHLLVTEALEKAIVFTATKRDADYLAQSLRAKGHSVAALHGDMHQKDRNRTIRALHTGSVKVLVATDVAARGIDVVGVSHVVNFDFPKSAEDYVHRIGRTGRAGASGIAISFAAYDDLKCLKSLQRMKGQSIPTSDVPGFEPKSRVKSIFENKPKRNGRFGSRGGRAHARWV